MASDERKQIALDAISSRNELFRSAVAATADQVRGLLSGTGDVAEDCVTGDARIEEFMGFLNHDYKRAGFFAFIPSGQVFPMDIAAVDTPGEVVGD